MPNSENERIIRQFLRLVTQESRKAESNLLPPEAWSHLDELKATLAAGQDDLRSIARGITAWCKAHQYSAMLQALRPVLSDDDPIGDEDPPINSTEGHGILTNISVKIFNDRLTEAQNKRESSSSQ
ncbi:MAG: hypothetical protein EA366_09950 [Spirulina sp. DLM2.Bin59]|nr:MAG: hypothetical protein EA366_09950 [Spirulina sp. DLM2.Bin59]